ncbi:MAG: zinc ribbon domain-containing protein [Myxococcales bacterium]|nr:zinc ribbon domain-containing protein [Myxococcales bacterium]
MQQATLEDTCSVCTTPYGADAHYCKTCGASIRPPDNCPACEHVIPNGSRFCPDCGIRMVGRRPSPNHVGASSSAESEARAEIQSVTQAMPKQVQGTNIIGNLLLFVAILAIILVVIREMNLGKPKEVSPFEGGAPPMAAAAGSTAPSSSVTSDQDIQGVIELGADIPAQTGTLFIVARIKGSAERGPPVAVKRIPQPTFPLQFRLGPSDVMLKSMPFTGPFDIRARLDADGNVMTKDPGDLFSANPTPAKPGLTGVKVVLDKRIE